MRFHTLILAVALPVLTCIAADESQVAVENRIAFRLSSAFRDYEILHPGVSITSLVQVLEITNRQQLIPWEESLRRFGSNAGFENSVLEKYVFLPRGAMIEDSTGGEVVLLSARPFTNANGGFNRAVVARLPDKYRGTILSEDHVQFVLKRAELAVPAPSVPEGFSVPGAQQSTTPRNDQSTPQIPQTQLSNPRISNHDTPNHSASKSDPAVVSNTIPQTVATATSGGRPSWIGMIIVLGMGLLFSIFLLFRTKQK